MDPATLMNEGSFANASVTSYNLAEIWQYPMNGGTLTVAESGGGLGLKRPLFAHNLSQFGDISAANREVSTNDPINLESRGSHGGNEGARKCRDAEAMSAKGASTSSGNGVVFINSLYPFNFNSSNLLLSNFELGLH